MNVLIKGKYGSVTNNYGVVITKREMNRWRDAIPKANRIIAQEKRIRRMSPLKYGDFAMDLRDSDLNRFRNKESFLSYLRTAEQIARGTYFRNRAIAYRQNYIKALEMNYGSLAKKLINKIKRMKIADFRRLVETDQLQSIGYIYFETTGEAEDHIQSIAERVGAVDTGHGSLKTRATIRARSILRNEAKAGNVRKFRPGHHKPKARKW